MKHFLHLAMAVLCQISYAQTGPAGIGSTGGASDLCLWLDANTISQSNNTNITNWSDQSGFSNNALASSGKEPTFKTNVLNGHPVIDFNRYANEYLYVNDHTSLKPNTMSLFVVGKFTNNTNAWSPFVIKASDWEWEDGYSIAKWNTNNRIEGYVSEYDKNYVVKNISANTDYIMSMVYDKSKVELFVNEQSAGTDNHSSNIDNSTNKMYIGISPDASGSGSRNPLDGHIAEIIMFKSDVNDAQRIIIHNYLSAKYGVGLIDNDVYQQDNSVNGNFDHDVAGIGRVNSSNQHTTSQGTGIIQVSNASHLQDKEFLMWGHDGNTLTFTNNTDRPLETSNRLARTWRVSEIRHDNYSACDVGSIDMQFDLTGVSGATEETLKLIVDTDGDGSLADEIPFGEANEVAPNVYVFSQITALTNGTRFSLGLKDAVTWDGTNYDLGNRPDEAPGNGNWGQDFILRGTPAYITKNAAINNLIVTNGSGFTLKAGKRLTVNGDISNEGTIIIEDGASLIQTANTDNNSGTGTYTIKRTGNNSSNVYNIWSSPIQNAQLTTIFNDANACDIWTFDGQTQSWLYDYVGGSNINCLGNSVTVPSTWTITGGDNIMDPAQGYFVPGSTVATRSFTGTVNNGTITTPIYTTSLGNNPNWDEDDWNLVGNPYPSAISATAFWTENAIDNARITEAVYFWDEGDTTSGYHQNNDYATWNLLGGASSNNTSVIPTGEIASGQGFWVYAAANTNLVFNNSMRTNNNTQFFKTTPEETKRAWVAIESPSGYENNILIGFNDQTTDQFDNGFDAHKNAGNANIKLASMIGLDEFAIQGIQAINWNAEKEIPLAIFSADSGMHIISELNREHLDSTYTVYLKDKMNGKTYNLAAGNAQVNLSAGINYTQRFSLIFKHAPQKINNPDLGLNPDLVTIGGDTTKADSNVISNIEYISQVYLNFKRNGNQIYITNEDHSVGNAQVFNVNGQLIESIQIGPESTQNLKSWSTLSNGIYLLQLTSANGHKITHKVVK